MVRLVSSGRSELFVATCISMDSALKPSNRLGAKTVGLTPLDWLYRSSRCRMCRQSIDAGARLGVSSPSFPHRKLSPVT